MPQRAYGSEDDPTAALGEVQDGDTGGKKKSLAGRMKEKAKIPGIKDKVKNLKSKVRILGMKNKDSGTGGEGDDSSEYDDEQSPRSPASTPNSESGYNTGPSTPYTTVKTGPAPTSNTSSSSPQSTSNTSPSPYNVNSTSSSDDVQQSRDFATTPSTQHHFPSTGYNTTVAPQPPATDLQSETPSGLDKFTNLRVADGSRYAGDQSGAQHGSPVLDYGGQEPLAGGTKGGSSGIEAKDKGYGGSPTAENPSPTGSDEGSLTTKAAGRLTSVKDTIVGSAAAAAGVVGAKMGYYKDGDDAIAAAQHGGDRDGHPTAGDAQTGKTYTQQATDTWAGVKSSVVSTLGLDKPRDPSAAPSVLDKAKATLASAAETAKSYTSTASDHAARTKDRVSAQTGPTHHDKALSEQVTQTLSSLPAAIKDKVFGPASPSKSSNGAATSPDAGSPSVTGRVSGAVSSLFASAPAESSRDQQHAFPAHSDYVKPADQRFAEEPASSASAYPSVNN